MKKIFFLIMIACTCMFASCAQDEGALGVVAGEETTEVTICTNLATATKAAGLNPGSQFSGLDNVDPDTYEVRYQLAVLHNDVQVRETMMNREPITANPSTTSFKVNLVRGQEYRFVIWADFVKIADQGADLHYVTADGLDKIKMQIGNLFTMNDESKDAYYVSENRTVSTSAAGSTISLTLKRPLAKLRFIATDYLEDEFDGICDIQSYYTTPSTIYTDFDAITGEVTGGVSLATTNNGVNGKRDCKPIYHPETKQAELFWDYMFVPKDEEVRMTFYMAFKPNATAVATSKVFSNTAIVVKQNHMTTVRSTLFTAEQTVDVTINDEFEDYINLSEGKVFIGDVIYPTIAAAMLAAEEGDIIRLLEGTYNEDVTLKKGVTLQGTGKSTILTGYIHLNEGSTLKDMRSYYNGQNTSGTSTRTVAYVAGSNVTISKVIFDAPANDAERHFIPVNNKQDKNETIVTVTGVTNFTFTGNTINTPYWKGIYMNSCVNYTITENIFNNLNPFSVDNFSTMTITNNTFIRSGLSNTRMIHLSGPNYTKDITTEWAAGLLDQVKQIKKDNTWEDTTITANRRNPVRVSNYCIGGPGDDPTAWIWYTP